MLGMQSSDGREWINGTTGSERAGFFQVGLKLGGCYGVPPLAEGCREPSRSKPRLGLSDSHPARLRAPLAL